MYTYVSNNPLIYRDPSGHVQEIGGSAFETRSLGSNGILYNTNGSVAWDYYLAWRNSDRLTFDKLANSGKGITNDQMMVMRLTLSFVTYVDDGTLVLLMESDGQYGLAKGIMQKYGVKAGTRIAVKGTGEATTLFRGERSSVNPDVAFKQGLTPKGTHDSLEQHVTSNTTAGNFISTISKKGIAEQSAGKNGYVYEINTSNYIDVNKTLN